MGMLGRKYPRRKYYLQDWSYKDIGEKYIPDTFACFDNQGFTGLKDLFLTAVKSIYIASYHLVLDEKGKNTFPSILVKILNEKRKSDIDIKILLNSRYPNTSMQIQHDISIKILKKLHIPCQSYLANYTMHAKFVIIDGRKVFIGSHNLSNTSLSKNKETSILITNEGVANVFTDYFIDCWLRSTKDNSP